MEDQRDLTAGASTRPFDRRRFLAGAGGVLAAAAAVGIPGAASAGASQLRRTPDSKSSGTISFLDYHLGTPSTGLGLAYTNARKYFQQHHPHETIRFDAAPTATYVASLTTKIQAGILDDVVVLLPDSTDEPAWSGLKHFTSSIQQSFPALSGWPAAAISNSEYFGVPCGLQGVVWYYNKKLFTKAGLDPNAPPTTWAAFATACNKLKAAGITPLGISGTDSYTPWWMWNGLIAQYVRTPSQIAKVKSGQIKITDRTFLEPLKYVQQTYANGWWGQNFAGKQFTDVENSFNSGEVAIVCGIIDDIVNWTLWDEHLGKNAYGVFATPVVPGVPSKQITFANPALVLGFSKTNHNKALSDAWVSYLVSARGQLTQLLAAGQFPNRTDVDVARATGSPGAGQIEKILKTNDLTDSALNVISAGAQSAALQQLTSAVTGNQLPSFLATLEQQQQG